MVADQKNSEAYEFIEEISEKGLDLSYQIFLLKRTGNISLAALGMMVVMMPLFFFAMYEKNGEPLEVILFHFIEAQFLRPKIRVYRTDNYYAALMRQAEVEREVEEIVSRYQESVPAKGKKNLSGAGKS